MTQTLLDPKASISSLQTPICTLQTSLKGQQLIRDHHGKHITTN